MAESQNPSEQRLLAQSAEEVRPLHQLYCPPNLWTVC